MNKVDCWFELSDERLLACPRVPEIERLHRLDQLVTVTLMTRAAPTASGGTELFEAGARGRTGSGRLA